MPNKTEPRADKTEPAADKSLPAAEIRIDRRAEHLGDIEEAVASVLKGLAWDKPDIHAQRFRELAENGFHRLSIPEGAVAVILRTWARYYANAAMPG
jgi:hypothetical protein